MPEQKTFLKVNRFHSSLVKALYPGMRMVQLEPGPVSGWIFSCFLDDLHINIGTLDRAVLLEGIYTKGMVNIGFVLNPDSSAQVQGHTYDTGTLSIDIDDVPMHEVFPAHMVWVGVTGATSYLLKGIDRLPKTSHWMLKGPRDELAPLLSLTERCLNHDLSFTKQETAKRSAQFLDTLRSLILSRLAAAPHENLYPEGDKFRMFIVDRCYKLEKTNPRQALSLNDICRATGIKGRTLQHYFKEMYGMGPTEYFRVRRLNSVRNDLLEARKDEVTVGGIAEQWGFFHMGRFSLSYKRQFGESPSETLARVSGPDAF